MVPPSQSLNLDAEAISGILGSISIACWVTVFTPQILENFRRGSAESLSIEFIVIWSLGDLFNVFGGILQGVLPTMLILAVYYVLADIVLIWQCLYYRGVAPEEEGSPTPPSERQPQAEPNGHHRPSEPERRSSVVDATHLSPATPLAEPTKPRRRSTPLQTALLNLLAVLMVAGAGIFGWWVSTGSQHGPQNHDHGHGPAPPHHERGELFIDPLGQVFGYGCMVMYLGSRVPQLILNWRRQSTDGLSGMFFLFACLGNVTYFLSILAYEPACVRDEGGCEEGEASRVYGRYLLVNLSWLIGSIGCLGFDFGILLQFIRYSEANERVIEGDGERMPLLDGTESREERR